MKAILVIIFWMTATSIALADDLKSAKQDFKRVRDQGLQCATADHLRKEPKGDAQEILQENAKAREKNPSLKPITRARANCMACCGWKNYMEQNVNQKAKSASQGLRTKIHYTACMGYDVNPDSDLGTAYPGVDTEALAKYIQVDLWGIKPVKRKNPMPGESKYIYGYQSSRGCAERAGGFPDAEGGSGSLEGSLSSQSGN